MTEEEKYLEKLLGRNPGFKVPDGYFDDFTSQLMEKLPNREPRAVTLRPRGWRRFRPVMLAAACTLAAVFALGTYLRKADTADGTVAPQEQVAKKTSSYSTFDAAMDYTMMDNEDIYAYVTGN